MHLSECVDLFSASNSFDQHVRSCVYDWSFKTTTSFYGWEDRLQLNWMFGALCWSYSLAGIMMFVIKPSWIKRSRFPYFFMATLLTFIQGPLSFSADYMKMTGDTFIHVFDRFMAVFNVTLQFWKLFEIFFHGRPGTFYVQLCAITFAIFSFMNSQDAQEAHDCEGFIFWHNCWHVYPLIGIVIESFDYFYLGDYDAMSKTSKPFEMDTKLTLQQLWHSAKSMLLSSDSNFVVSNDGTEKKKKK